MPNHFVIKRKRVTDSEDKLRKLEALDHLVEIGMFAINAKGEYYLTDKGIEANIQPDNDLLEFVAN